MRARSDCAALVGQGSIRINRQPTGKAHAKLRVGDVLTVPVHGSVRVVRVLRLAARRGPALEARLLYEEVFAESASGAGTQSSNATAESAGGAPCAAAKSPAYRRF